MKRLTFALTGLFFGGCVMGPPASPSANMDAVTQQVHDTYSDPEVVVAFVPQLGMRAAVFTKEHVILTQAGGGSKLQWLTDLAIPLNAIVSVEVTSNAVGGVGRAAAAFDGVRLVLNKEVADHIYKTGAREISFDASNVYFFENGRVARSIGTNPNSVVTAYGSKADVAAELCHLIKTLMQAQQQSVPAVSSDSIEAQLRKLKDLLEKGLIDRATYDARAAELVRKI